MTYILGINSFHADSSAALLQDGKILFAAEEERFNRKKHWAGFPIKSIQHCLKENNINLNNIDHISINCSPRANFIRKVIYSLKNKPNPTFIAQRIKNKSQRVNLKDLFIKYFPDEKFTGKFHFIEHHKSHLSSAFYASNFKESVVLSVDGFGDFASSAWGLGFNNNLSIDEKIYFPDSLGIFYSAITQFLGFPNYGDEYKVMGLAPYGEDKYQKEMNEIIKFDKFGKFYLNQRYFLHATEKINHQWSECIPVIDNLFSNKLKDLLGNPRKSKDKIQKKHKDIAHSAQLIYEKALFNLLNYIYSIYKVENLCIAGGCGANSVANGKIKKFTPFKKIYVHPAPGDAGGALGSAYEVWHKIQEKRCVPMGGAYLGPSFSNSFIENLLREKDIKKNLRTQNCSISKIGDIKIPDEEAFFSLLANKISEGLVIGWFQGKMEWGPRALGNRSILCDPRRTDIKDILNLKIKKRESFRPFAPSILREYVTEWFEEDSEVPYMMQVYKIKEDKRSLIPAVTHVDGTGRLQTVEKGINYKYYKLIKAFYELTKVPILLNTSFNENEPIVHNPTEAINCFLRTKMDILVMEDFLIMRK